MPSRWKFSGTDKPMTARMISRCTAPCSTPIAQRPPEYFQKITPKRAATTVKIGLVATPHTIEPAHEHRSKVAAVA